MTRDLVVTVHFHDGRYHGHGDWPPAPARLFQALVAGAATPKLSEEARAALTWLERLDAPTIAAPTVHSGQHVEFFVPNNDMDSQGGDIRRIGKVRTSTKHVRPRLFDASLPILYVWRYGSGSDSDMWARQVCDLAMGVYQLGRGVDMAWAVAECLEESAMEARLDAYEGAIYRHSKHGGGIRLDCPEHGSLGSLENRYAANPVRFRRVGGGGKSRIEFSNVPKPRFRSVVYNSSTVRLLFDLRRTAEPAVPFAPWPLEEVAALVIRVRGDDSSNGAPPSGAYKRLADAFPTKKETINRTLIGRDAKDADKAQRLRIIPLPSIGSTYVDRAIRRVLVEVPPDCPLRGDDVEWAFSGLVVLEHDSASRVFDEETGELLTDAMSSLIQLVPATDRSMLEHYGIDKASSSHVWRSVTPIVLPVEAARRRINPARQSTEAKDGTKRFAEQRRAAGAVLQALRHAGVRATPVSVRVQREPFEARGSRVESFARGTRFAKERLWHAELRFATAVQGPLVLGDGRFMGLGLMSPVEGVQGVHVLRILDAFADEARPTTVSNALRRAVMSRVQATLARGATLPSFFTGHERDGTPLRGNAHRHLAFVADLARRRVLIVAPHVMEHRHATREEKEHLAVLDESLNGFAELRAGTAGKVGLIADIAHDDDPLLVSSLRWESVTDYQITRHPKRTAAREALVLDATDELARRNLPKPVRIEAIKYASGPRGGISGRLRLEFAVAVSGPILIGRTCHGGGGLFEGVHDR